MKYTSVICIGLLMASFGALSSQASAVEVEMGVSAETQVESVAPADPVVEPDVRVIPEQDSGSQKADALPVVNNKAPVDARPLDGEPDFKDVVIGALLEDGMPLFVPKTDEDVVVMKENERFTKGIESGWIIFPEWHHLSIVENSMFVIPFVHGLSDTDIYYHLSLLEYDDKYGDITFHGTYTIGQDIADLLVEAKDGVVNISYKDVSAGADKAVEKNLALALDGQRFVLAK